MSNILYVTNSPFWTDITPNRLNDTKMFDNPLSENFTFFNYNLMKYGLVKKVIIYNNNTRRGEIDGALVRRAQVEAFQLDIPVISMSHIGVSDLIKNNKNREISNNIDEMPNKLKIMLDNYHLYSLKTFENYLKSNLFMPQLVKNIKLSYNKKLNG